AYFGAIAQICSRCPSGGESRRDRQSEGHRRRSDDETDQPVDEGHHAKTGSPSPSQKGKARTASRCGDCPGCCDRHRSSCGWPYSSESTSASTPPTQTGRGSSSGAASQTLRRNGSTSSETVHGRENPAASGKIRPRPLRERQTKNGKKEGQVTFFGKLCLLETVL